MTTKTTKEPETIEGETIDQWDEEPRNALQASTDSLPATSTARDAVQLLRTAVAQGISPDGLEKLVALQERMEATDARRAFFEAMWRLQGALRPVGHSRKGAFAMYTELPVLERAVRPLLHEHGFSYTWDSTTSADDVMTSVFHLRHRGGHEERSTFSARIDRTAKQMNSMQQSASALSYTRRYSLLLGIGASTGDRDTDGNSTGDDGAGLGIDRTPISVDQWRALRRLLSGMPADIEEGLCGYMEVARMEEIPAARFDKARRALVAKRRRAGLPDEPPADSEVGS